MSRSTLPSCPHTRPHSFDHKLPAAYFESTFTPCLCAAGLPFQMPHLGIADFAEELLRLRHVQAELEDEIVEQYGVIERLRGENANLRRVLRPDDQRQQNTISMPTQYREHPRADMQSPRVDTGLRQITTELELLNLRSTSEALAFQISGLEAKFTLLADEMRDQEKSITLLAETMSSGALMEGSETEGETEEEEDDGEVHEDGSGNGMRGGMGGRDEDEEFVCGYGGYTNWDQVDEEEGKSVCGFGDGQGVDEEAVERRAGDRRATDAEGGDGETQQVGVNLTHIFELERQIARLEGQIERIRAALSTPPESTASPVSNPSDYQEEDSNSDIAPHLRGGSAHPSTPFIPSPSPNLSQTFATLYTTLIHHTASPHPRPDCTEVWIELATVLQLRNAFLERELEEYREMCDSLTSDVRWQMGTQVELEELCEELELERDGLVEEVRVLRGGDVSQDRISRSETDCAQSVEPSANAIDEEAETTARVTEPSTSHIPFTSFTYHPQRSHITFPTTPQQIFHFPSAPTLPLIYAALNHRRRYIGEDNAYLLRVREILDAREVMGIILPDSLKEEQVEIGIPNCEEKGRVAREVEIVAWESAEEGVREMEECIKRLGLDGDVDCEDEVSECGDYFGDAVSSERGLCGYSCCAEEERSGCPDTFGSTETPMVTVRGGGFEHDGTLVSYSDDSTESETGSPGPGWDEDIFPRSSKGIGVPPNSTQASETSIQTPQIAATVHRREDYTKADESESSRVTMTASEEEFWRHSRGRGCEEWTNKLDGNRQRCTFCDLPFSDEQIQAQSRSVKSVRHEDDAPIPTSIPMFPRPQESEAASNNFETTNEDSQMEESVLYMRGGGVWCNMSESIYSEHSDGEEDWRLEWTTLATQTHHSNHQHPVYRNSSTLSTKEVEKPSTPITRHKSHPQIDLPSLFDEHGNKRYNLWYVGYGGLRLGTEDAVQEDEEDVYHSKIPQTLSPHDRRPGGGDGVHLNSCQAAVHPIQSSVMTCIFSEGWFENPRPAPPIPITRRNMGTRAYLRKRLATGLPSTRELKGKFIASLESHGLKTTPNKSGSGVRKPSKRFPRKWGPDTRTSKVQLRHCVKRTLRRRRDCICEIFELSKPRPRVNIDALPHNAAAGSTVGTSEFNTAQLASGNQINGVDLNYRKRSDIEVSPICPTSTIHPTNITTKTMSQPRQILRRPTPGLPTPKDLLNKPLPPTPPTSQKRRPLRNGKDPIIAPNPVVPTGEPPLEKKAEYIVAAADMQIEDTLKDMDSSTPMTIAGPSDPLKSILKELKAREREERQKEADRLEALDCEEKWKGLWVAEQALLEEWCMDLGSSDVEMSGSRVF